MGGGSMSKRNDDSRQERIDRNRQRAEDAKYTGGSDYIKLPDGVTLLKTKKGTMELDFLQFEAAEDMVVPINFTKDIEYKKGDLIDKITIFVHRKIGADSKSYICPRTIKEPCPICEERARLQKDYKANEALVKAFKPQIKELYNVINLDDKKAGVQLLEYSYANFGKMLDEEVREGREDWGAYAELEGG